MKHLGSSQRSCKIVKEKNLSEKNIEWIPRNEQISHKTSLNHQPNENFKQVLTRLMHFCGTHVTWSCRWLFKNASGFTREKLRQWVWLIRLPTTQALTWICIWTKIYEDLWGWEEKKVWKESKQIQRNLENILKSYLRAEFTFRLSSEFWVSIRIWKLNFKWFWPNSAKFSREFTKIQLNLKSEA